MKTIEYLNTEYVKAVETTATLKMYKRLVSDVQSDLASDEDKKALESAEYYDDLSKAVDCSEFQYLNRVIQLIRQFKRVHEVIQKFNTAILENYVSEQLTNSIITEQERYKEYQLHFNKDFGKNTDTPKALNRIISDSFSDAVKISELKEKDLKNEAREIISKQLTTEVKITDPINKSEELPLDMIVASHYEVENPLEILESLGVKQSSQNIIANLKTQGNVMLHTNFSQLSDDLIDNFVISYIFRYLHSFPLGSANVHIFDKNASHLYRRLTNYFQVSDNRDATKSVVRLHSDMKDLAAFRDVVCEDIFKKIGSREDLYELYETDRTDPFNLIVLRRGLDEGSGTVKLDAMELINTLSKPKDIGHRCGLRFLIIDGTDFNKNSGQANADRLIQKVIDNCELKISYNKNRFTIHQSSVAVLYQNGDLDKNIRELSARIIEKINNRENSYIKFTEVRQTSKTVSMESIMRIPVGKSGDDIFELPFSCRDEAQTPAGTCIGYMVIGQTGSGKSSLFHSIVINGCLKYSPRDLQFWLLDFKHGGSSSKYSKSGIPHIRYIAENNNVDDAVCLFQMVLEEMERRIEAFNSISVDDISAYNIIAEKKKLEHFPRIIIAIDEIQEVLRDELHTELKRLIASIASRMRSSGIHFVMFSQNLAETNSSVLREAFLPHASGRVCFRVEPRIPGDSGFGDDYVQRKQEISELKTGEAYASYGRNTIKKVKMAFVNSEDMEEQCFAPIRKMYPSFRDSKPLVIGTRQRLSIISNVQGKNSNYYSLMNGISSHDGIYEVLLGEDVYRMTPHKVSFSSQNNSALMILGTDKLMASSICTSAALSLARQKVRTYLINGDIALAGAGENNQHPFMKVCMSLSNADRIITNHVPDDLKTVVKDIYSEYLDRQNQAQKQIYGLSFSPLFLIVNDLYGIVGFRNNVNVENRNSSTNTGDQNGFFKASFSIKNTSSDPSDFSLPIQNIMSTLIRDGYRYNIHLILAIKGEAGMWRALSLNTDIQKAILFNENVFADQFSDTYSLKSMLKSISNDSEEETLAVFRRGKTYTKIRPIIYKMNVEMERKSVEKLIKG